MNEWMNDIRMILLSHSAQTSLSFIKGSWADPKSLVGSINLWNSDLGAIRDTCELCKSAREYTVQSSTSLYYQFWILKLETCCAGLLNSVKCWGVHFLVDHQLNSEITIIENLLNLEKIHDIPHNGRPFSSIFK